MSNRRRTFSAEFKREAVQLAAESGQRVSQIAHDLGIHANTLYRWRQELRQNGPEAFPGQGRLPPGDEELRRLKRELDIVKQERDILKKAISIFSRQRP